MTRDDRKLIKALEAIEATPLQQKMAFILLRCNGLNNALNFVEQIKQGCECGADYDESNRCAKRC